MINPTSTHDGTPKPWDNLWEMKKYRTKEPAIRYYIVKEMKEITREEWDG